MHVVKELALVSVEEYLASELVSPMKHEYLAGAVYAMAGAKNQHNDITGNCFARLHVRLKRPCKPYNSDTKVRVRLSKNTHFYYPDLSVVCRPNPPTDTFHDEPVLIVEVISESTRRIDAGEKKDAYLTIGSLSAYLLVEPDAPAVVAHRRTKHGFVREVYQGLDAVIPLSEIGIELPLAEIYEGVQFVPEPEE